MSTYASTDRSLFRTLVDLAVVVPAVTLRRLRSGPRRPSWDYRYELVAEGLRRAARLTRHLSPQAIRRGLDLLGSTTPIGYLTRRRRPEDAPIPAEWFGVEGKPVILYFHGGGYVAGSLTAYRDPLERLAKWTRSHTLAVEYRLAPEHKHPAALEDALAIWEWLGNDNVYIGGDSAGGGLTLALLMTLRDRGLPMPKGAFVISPWADLDPAKGVMSNLDADYVPPATQQDYAEAYHHDLDDPLVSPNRGDLSGLPPLLVMYGGAEVLRDVGRELAARSEAAGVDTTVYEGADMIHAWPLFSFFLPEARTALRFIGDWIADLEAPQTVDRA